MNTINLLILHALVLILFLPSCEKEGLGEGNENESSVSNFSEDESHYFGRNCMDCHYSEGRGNGWFTLAGSVGGNSRRATIELFHDVTSPPVHSIEVDRKGNCYTTEPIDYSIPYIVRIKDQNNNFIYMPQKITHGQCNLCHDGYTAKKLIIN